MRVSTFVSALGALLLVSSPAFAQPGPGPGRWGHGMGMGGGMGGGPGGLGHCAAMLIHAPPAALKAKLGLSDAQIAKLQPIRTNFMSKRIALQAQAQQQALQLKTYVEGADVPDQKKVLDLARKINATHWQIVEERVKAQIQILQVMSKDQRAKFRAECATMGPGKGMGMGMGRGRGWHGRPGGPGAAW